MLPKGRSIQREAYFPLENYIGCGMLLKRGTYLLQGKPKERWLDVCSEAAICDDPERLKQLTTEIDAILREEKERLETTPPFKKHTAA
jgi:hypothetical protein